jgi:hypothetical protein
LFPRGTGKLRDILPGELIYLSVVIWGLAYSMNSKDIALSHLSSPIRWSGSRASWKPGTSGDSPDFRTRKGLNPSRSTPEKNGDLSRPQSRTSLKSLPRRQTPTKSVW